MCLETAPCFVGYVVPITITGPASCELVFDSYGLLPTISWTTSQVSEINVTTRGGPLILNGPNTYSFSGANSLLRFKNYVGLHNASFSVSAQQLHFENANISDQISNGLVGRHPSSVSMFPVTGSLTKLSITSTNVNISNFAVVLKLQLSISTTNVVAQGFNVTSSYVSAGFLPAAIFASASVSTVKISNFGMYGVMPFNGYATSLIRYEYGRAVMIPGSLNVAVALDTFELEGVRLGWAQLGTNGFMIPNVKNFRFTDVITTTVFTSGSFVTLGGVLQGSFEKSWVRGWVLIDSTSVVTADAQLSFKNTTLSMAHTSGGSPLIVKTPTAASQHVTHIDIIDGLHLRCQFNGYQMKFDGHIVFSEPVSFISMSLQTGVVDSTITAPSLEIVEDFRGGNTPTQTPSIFFNTSLSVRAVNFINAVVILRDDQIYFSPAARFGRGIITNVPFECSTIMLRWTLPPPAILSEHAVSFNVVNITNFTIPYGDTRFNVTGRYLEDFPNRFRMTFQPSPCPAACAGASIRRNNTALSLCSTNSQCFSEIDTGTISGDVRWNFGPLTIIENGTVSFTGSSNFGAAVILEGSTISSFLSDTYINGSLTAYANTSISVHGATVVLEDAVFDVLSNLSFFGDFTSGSIEIGDYGIFHVIDQTIHPNLQRDQESEDGSRRRDVNAIATFQINGNMRLSNVVAVIDAMTPTITDNFGLYNASTLRIQSDAKFTIGGDLEFSDDTFIQIDPIFTANASRRSLRRNSGDVAYFESSGSANVSGTMNVTLTNSDLQALNASSGKIAIVKGFDINGNINLLVQAESGCASLDGYETRTEDAPGGKVLTAYFAINTDACASPTSTTNPDDPPSSSAAKKTSSTTTWPIILGSVLGGVALLVFVAIILIISIPSLKAKVVPYATPVNG